MKNLSKRLKWNDAFLEYVTSLDETKPVIICGDMNVAREIADVSRKIRKNGEAGFTHQERRAMRELLKAGFTDAFRELYPNRIEAFTFWQFGGKRRERNWGWRLDYFIVSNRLKQKIDKVTHETHIMGSDHCPITLYIDITE